MRVLVLPTSGYPSLKEIDGSLRSMQDLVGGFIEAAHRFPNDGVVICNEEGWLKNLPRNPWIQHLVGTVFICKGRGPELVGLDDRDVRRWASILGIRVMTAL